MKRKFFLIGLLAASLGTQASDGGNSLYFLTGLAGVAATLVAQNVYKHKAKFNRENAQHALERVKDHAEKVQEKTQAGLAAFGSAAANQTRVFCAKSSEGVKLVNQKTTEVVGNLAKWWKQKHAVVVVPSPACDNATGGDNDGTGDSSLRLQSPTSSPRNRESEILATAAADGNAGVVGDDAAANPALVQTADAEQAVVVATAGGDGDSSNNVDAASEQSLVGQTVIADAPAASDDAATTTQLTSAPAKFSFVDGCKKSAAAFVNHSAVQTVLAAVATAAAVNVVVKGWRVLTPALVALLHAQAVKAHA